MKIIGNFIITLIVIALSIGQLVHYLFWHTELSQMEYFIQYGWFPSIIVGISLGLNLTFFLIDENDFEIIKWYYWSRFPLFWYWVNQRSGDLWKLLVGNSISDSKVDWIATIGQDEYHSTLRKLIIKTGKNIYGQKLG